MDVMFYSLKEAAEKLNKTEEEIKEIVKQGKLREFREGPNSLFKVDEIEALMSDTSIMPSKETTVPSAQKPEEEAIPSAPEPVMTQEPAIPPGPTPTPEPIETPEPTEIPELIETPEPTILPEPTEMPEPAMIQEPAVPPEPTPTPEPIETPEPAEIPELMDTFESAMIQEPSAAPEPIEIPEPAEIPELMDTFESAMIQEPSAAAEPTETPEPAMTQEPAVPPEPTPEPIETPEPGEIPELMDTFESAFMQESSAAPEPTEKQEPTEIPELIDTSEPAMAQEPSFTPEPSETSALESDLTGADTAIAGTGEGLDALGETDTGAQAKEDTVIEAKDTTAETPLQEIEEDVNLDSFGSGSGLLDLSLQADDTSLGGILDEIYAPEAGEGEHAEETGSAVEMSAEAEQILPGGTYAGTGAVSGVPVMARTYAEPEADTVSNALGIMLFLPLLAIIYTAVVAVTGFSDIMPSIREQIQGMIWYIAGGAVVLALLIVGVAYMLSNKAPATEKKTKAKKEKKSKKEAPPAEEEETA